MSCAHEWTKETHPGPDTRYCNLCNETETDAELSTLLADVKRLKAERDEARKWLEGICSEFEGAVAHADWRAAGSKGMSVTFTGDFASVVQLPGAINKMRWWVNVFRDAL